MFRSSLVLSLMLLGCADEKQAPFKAPPPPGESLKSEKSRITEFPQQAVFDGVIRGNTETALSLHRKLIEGDEGLFFSPLSIQSVAGMLAGGANGATSTEFGRVLPLSNAADFHRSMNQLDIELSSRGVNSKGAEGEPFAFVRLNQLFVDDAQNVAPAYLDLLAEEYGVGVQRLALSSNPGGAETTINQWVSDATRTRIPSLFAPGSFNERSKLVLVNAMYFSAGWATAFSSDVTVPFMSIAGASSTVQMMKASNVNWSQFENETVQAVSVPYSGNELSMRIVMPKSNYRDFEASLDAVGLNAVFAGLQPELVDLTMPPFELRARRDLKPAFEALGVSLPFKPFEADFSAIDGTRELYVDTFVHEAWIEVTKSGTRAAAATGAGVSNAPSAPPQPKPIVIDKPFLFFIVDDATGAIVFMGRYTKP